MTSEERDIKYMKTRQRAVSSEERDMIIRRDTGPAAILVASVYEVHTSEERDIENIKSMKIRHSYGVL